MPTCFVVMGFGKKTDFETGRTLDLDKTYRNIIKPAVTAAGLECIRADEIAHSGVIDVPMYEQLLSADVVVADLSTSNKNAFYELGVRHALRPHTTIVICENGAKSFPFDVNHVAIRQYHHMGEGIDFEEVERFRSQLTEAIKDILGKDPRPKDSPVYTFLNDLTPPALAQAMRDIATEVARAAPVVEAAAAGGKAYAEIMEQVDEAQKEGDFVTAKALLTRLRRRTRDAAAKAGRPEDPYLLQRLALVTYKSKQPSPVEALEEARTLLATLEPDTSNDTETLGLWGAVHKRLWEISQDRGHLDAAIRAYERGFYLRNDYYNGINFAYSLNERAALSCRLAESAKSHHERTHLRANAVGCFVKAEAVRQEVLEICDTVLTNEKLSDDDRYWVLATMAEARLGTGDVAGAERQLNDAFEVASAQWMRDSTQEQISKLHRLLEASPLKFVRSEEL